MSRISYAPEHLPEEELHRSIPVEERETPDTTVPLEEALLLDTVEQRRRLILSVLREDPARYYDLLQQARLNEDSEVVHYAATAMAQVAKQANKTLQQRAARYAAAPPETRAEARAAYLEALEQSLLAGLVQGRAAELLRQKQVQLLREQLGEALSYPAGCRLAGAELALREYAAAEQTLAALIRRWPLREEAWLLRLRSAAARRNGPQLKKLLREMEERQVYLSAAGRQEVAFWKGGSV